MNLQLWLNAFLERRGLTEPDGRDLYEYRPTKEEFESLEESLIAYFQNIYSFNRVVGPTLAAGMNLYAAMWFAFRYGSPSNNESEKWGWDGIYRDLKITDSEITQNKRSEFVTTGADWWKNNRLSYVGHYYIGYLFSQGGIGVNGLATGSCWYTNLISQSFLWFRKYRSTEENLNIFLQEHLDNIPDGVDTDVACRLISQATLALYRFDGYLKHMDPSTTLTTDLPAARQFSEEFPGCAIDEQDLNLVRQWLLDTTEIKTGSGLFFSASRHLDIRNPESPHLFTFVGLHKHSITHEEFFIHMGVKPTGLPKRGILSLGGRGCGKFEVRPEEIRVKLENKSGLYFKDENAFKPVYVNFGANCRSTAPLRNADLIDAEEPLYFIESLKDPKLFDFLGSGSIKTPATKLLVLVPQRAIVPNGTVLVEDYRGRKIVELTASATIQLDDESFEAELSGKEEETFDYQVLGQLLKYTQNGIPIYRGRPIIRPSVTNSTQQKVCVEWTDDLGNPLPDSPDSATLAFVRIRNADGRIVKRLRLLLLPQLSSESISVSYGSRPGQLLFRGWNLRSCLCDDPNVTIETNEAGDTAITCPLREDTLSSDIVFECCGRNITHSFKIAVTYPTLFAGFVFREDRRILHREASVRLTDLKNIKALVLVNPKDIRSCYLRIEPDRIAEDLQIEQRHVIFDYDILIDERSGEGSLDLEAVVADIYRAMRVSANPRNERYVSISLIYGNNKTKIMAIAYRSLLTLCTDTESGQTAVRLNDLGNYATKTIVAKTLLTNVSDGTQLFEVTTDKPEYLPQSLLDRSEPVWLCASNDEKYRTAPLILPPDRALDPKEQHSYLEYPDLWSQDQNADVVRSAFEAYVHDLIIHPDNKDWAVFDRQLTILGLRGFCWLPYWSALRNNVPLAFVFAAILQIHLTSPEKNNLLSELAKVQAWRWELIPQKSFKKAVLFVKRFLRLKFAFLPNCDDVIPHLLQNALAPSSVGKDPLVDKKLTVGLLEAEVFNTEDLLKMFDGFSPVMKLTAGGQKVRRLKILELIREEYEKHSSEWGDSRERQGFREAGFKIFKEYLDEEEPACASLIDESLRTLPEIHKAQRLLLPFMILSAWELSDCAEDSLSALNKKRRLASRISFFFADFILNEDEELAVWAQEMSFLLLKTLKNEK